MTNLDKFYKKIEELSTLEFNWDNRGARTISPTSINNLIFLRREVGDWNFDTWQISPGVNGDIFINFKLNKVPAGIVLDGAKYSWYIEHDDLLDGESDQIFNAEEVAGIMKEIETSIK